MCAGLANGTMAVFDDFLVQVINHIMFSNSYMHVWCSEHTIDPVFCVCRFPKLKPR